MLRGQGLTLLLRNRDGHTVSLNVMELYIKPKSLRFVALDVWISQYLLTDRTQIASYRFKTSNDSRGPILHPAQLTLSVTQVSFLACTRRKADFSLHGRTSKWPCAPGGGSAKKEACSGANVLGAILRFPKNHSATDQEKGGLKTMAHYSDAILTAQAWSVRTAKPGYSSCETTYCFDLLYD